MDNNFEETIQEKLFKNSSNEKMYVRLSFARNIENMEEYINRLNYLNEKIDMYTEYVQLPISILDEDNMMSEETRKWLSKFYRDNLLDLTYLRDRYFYDGAEQQYIKNNVDKQKFIINKYDFEVNRSNELIRIEYIPSILSN
jgi:hypothetical protein